MKWHFDGILGNILKSFDLLRCLFANYLYSGALLRLGVFHHDFGQPMVAMARRARLSPTMANLGLSLSIPLSASVDTARAPQ